MNSKQIFNTSTNFVKNHSVVVSIIVVVVLLTGAFAAGRYTIPTKIVTKTEVQTVEKVVTQIQTQYVEKKVYVTDEKKNVVTVVDVVKKPDGTEETKTTITDKTETAATNTDQASSTLTDNIIKSDSTDSKTSKVVDNTKPQWHLALRVGGGAQFGLGAVSPRLDLGLQAERRILGPVFMGLYADVLAPVVGLPTPPYTVVGGLVVGLEL